MLTTDTFDALTIDHTTVRFGPGAATEFHMDPQHDEAELSVRDILMLDLMARGVSLREIAAHLHVTPKTVRSYRHQLEAKLEASGVNELVMKAGRALRTPLADS